ncbi:N,N'-diacetylchitobiose transport system permease protein [Saccharopolyspora lacisalsi]|uniref:N,N'-diacetylchitobiose transport system permease protein n=1 Tax=Halosaccharopolyspora lacisalsi TaxID=1000566 RepID=A0A839DYT7_9PSEU|nr:sugar ABC transporter permease [Halosaccharopolyspora lacisalsi]MBA8826030.1 N,N'-diacetylchitobiose transport system permease protein [Halosaccharopolyspora lacisalsi]
MTADTTTRRVGVEPTAPDDTAPPTRKRRGDGRSALFYLAPSALVLVGVMGYPLYQLVQLSLYDYGQAQASGGAPLEFLGWGNYATLLGDGRFWTVLVQTCAFAGVCVLGSLAVGIGLAVLAGRVRTLPRMLLFLAALGAWATPAVAGSTVWLFLFDQDFGLVNEVLVGIGLHGFEGFSWTYDRYVAFGLVAGEVIWCSFPFVLVTMYAGIKAIPGEVLEAASLDGASTWRTAREVIMPMLRPLLVIATIQSIIWDFKIFTQIYVMTDGGGIAGQNLVLNVYAYQEAFAGSNYGLGSAIGVVMTILLLIITAIYLRAQRATGERT